MCIKASILALTLVGLAACSPEPTKQETQPVQELVEAPIPMIKGHDLHNTLATSQLGLRDLYLSRIVRGLGEDCMVVDRSMYQGYAKDLGASLWSAHCEVGTEWMVSLNKDGSGSILQCRDLRNLDRMLTKGRKPKIKGLNCWERFED